VHCLIDIFLKMSKLSGKDNMFQEKI